MFMGEFSCKVDNKGRLTLPAKFREELGEIEIVVTRGFENSISIYPYSVWEEEIVEKQIKKLKNTNSKHRAYKNFIMSAATKMTTDSQGRLNIPSALISHGKIVKNAVVLGSFDHLEIWAEERWKEYMEDTSASIEELVDEIEF